MASSGGTRSQGIIPANPPSRMDFHMSICRQKRQSTSTSQLSDSLPGYYANMPSRTTRLSSTNAVQSIRRPARWDRSIPPPLRPIVRAYLLGYGFTVGPRVLTLLMYHASKLVRGSKRRAVNDDDGATQRKPESSLGEALIKILRAGLEVNRFATFSAAIVGGSTLLEVCLRLRPDFNTSCRLY